MWLTSVGGRFTADNNLKLYVWPCWAFNTWCVWKSIQQQQVKKSVSSAQYSDSISISISCVHTWSTSRSWVNPGWVGMIRCPNHPRVALHLTLGFLSGFGSWSVKISTDIPFLTRKNGCFKVQNTITIRVEKNSCQVYEMRRSIASPAAERRKKVWLILSKNKLVTEPRSDLEGKLNIGYN